MSLQRCWSQNHVFQAIRQNIMFNDVEDEVSKDDPYLRGKRITYGGHRIWASRNGMTYIPDNDPLSMR